MNIGYARVSTADQHLELQEDALTKIGCEKIFRDKASGGDDSRQGLRQAIEYARRGDAIVVWKLDRLGRSLKHLIETISLLNERGVGLVSLQEKIDTTTSGGKLIFHVFGALAEFERELIRERTNAGLRAARSRGRRGGRPPKLNSQQIAMARKLMNDPSLNVGEICRTMQISRATLYRYCPQSASMEPGKIADEVNSLDDETGLDG